MERQRVEKKPGGAFGRNLLELVTDNGPRRMQLPRGRRELKRIRRLRHVRLLRDGARCEI